MFNFFNHIHDNFFSNYMNKNINTNYSFISSIFNEINLSLNKNHLSYYIDKIEEKFAICENINTNEFIDIALNKLPKNIQEGDIVIFVNNKYIIDKDNTLKRKEIIENKVKNLWNNP